MSNKQFELLANFKTKGGEEGEDIIIEGFANTTDKDRAGDVIVESAWTKGGLDNYLKNPVILAFHDHSQPIGKMVDYGINNKGLHITATISKSAGNVYELIKSGIITAFSVGFRVKDADYDSETDIFVIKDLELHEISAVSVPMNADSLFSVAKSFDNEKSYDEFKDSFKINVEENISTEKKETHIVPIEDKNKGTTLTTEQIKALQDEAVAKAFTDAAAKAKATEEAEAKAKAVAIEAGTSGAERLMAEFEKRMEEKDATMSEALDGLRTELKEKSAEIEAMTNSKMQFSDDRDVHKATDLEIDTAMILATVLNKKLDETDYYKANLEKASEGAHLQGMPAKVAYEMIYSTNMYDAIQDKLVVEPLFTSKIQMTSRAMTFPFNPEAGYASWVDEDNYESMKDPSDHTVVANGDAPTDASSSGQARRHLISNIDLRAEKLASKEPLGYEEEEDAIIPIVPIITAAIARRMARTTDTELLRGNIGAASETEIGNAYINGVATLADDASTEYVQSGTFNISTNPMTVADLQATRRKMGSWGLNPKDVIYVVNETTYWDLLEDPDFRTMDLVGAQATILTGQVGAVNGSPVIVSDSFKTPATSMYAAIALNVNNYLFGELRGINTEHSKDVLNQKNWIVTTRRFAFKNIDPNGSATLNSCAVLKYPAS